MKLDRLRIFVSYPRGGAAHCWAEDVHAFLQREGARVFRDETAVKEGAPNWHQAIETGLVSADLVVAIIGTDSEVCRWQLRELMTADRLVLPVVLLRIAPVPLPFCVCEKQPVEIGADTATTLAALAAAMRAALPARGGTTLAHAEGSAAVIPADQRRDEMEWLDCIMFRRYSDREDRYIPLEGRERRSLSPERGMKSVRIDSDILFRAFGMAPEAERSLEERSWPDVLEAYRELGCRRLRRLAVLGEPGAGKTFSLERIALDYARRARDDAGAPIPLLVSLGLWTRDSERLEDFIARSLGGLGRHFPTLIDQRRAVLLLDAINEIPPGQRRFKADQIEDLARDERFASVVVSCREKDFGEFALPFDTLTLQPLTPPQVREFLHRVLALHREVDAEGEAEARFWQIAGGDAVRDAWQAWNEAGAADRFWAAEAVPDDVRSTTTIVQDVAWRDARFNPRSLLRLAANPYLLQIMAVLPELPANRARLFQGFLKVLYERERTARAARHDNRVPLPEVWTAALTGLAEALQRLDLTAEHDDGARTALAQHEWSAWIDDDLVDFGRDANVLELRAGQLRFTHQLLQEYLASRLMIDARRSGRSATDFWPPARWWERSGWEVVAELAADSCDGDTAAQVALIVWLAEANPEVAADIWRHADRPALPPSVLAEIAARWLARMTDPVFEPHPRARAAIGRAMGWFGLDTRPGVGLREDGQPDIDWIEIAGPEPFIYQDGTHPGLATYHLARYPVTNAQFQAFVDAGGYQDERWWEGLSGRAEAPSSPEWGEPNSPRETVNWYEAMAYCRWLSAVCGETISLPTEQQWERAARGRDGREYPWGAFDEHRLNCSAIAIEGSVGDVGRTSAVGIYPQGASAEGVLDLAGNVWEWCRNAPDEPEQTGSGGGHRRVLRGGAWSLDSAYCRAAYRYSWPGYRYFSFGFRVCRGSPIDDPPGAVVLDTDTPGR